MGVILFSRIIRAILYTIVIIIVFISGIFLNHPTSALSEIIINRFHILYVISFCFLMILSYVNVYILTPNPYFEESVKAKKWRKGLAIYNTIALSLVFFIIPSFFYFRWTFFLNSSASDKAIFLILFLIIPSFLYLLTIYRKSGYFYSKDNIDLRLFDFRHQLITPALLMITIPFCFGYILSNSSLSSSVFYFIGIIQFVYLLICYTKAPRTISFKISDKRIQLNLFFLLNILLFVLANFCAYYIYNFRFIIFAVWLGLFMMSFEYWTSVYFKESENDIRTFFKKPLINLGEESKKYYTTSAIIFTTLIVLFPITFLLNKSFSNIYIWIILLASFWGWYVWLKDSETIAPNLDGKILRIRKYKFIALAPSFAIILEDFLSFNFAYVTDRFPILIALSTFVLALYVAIYFVRKEPNYKVKLRNSFYYLCGILMGLVCLLLYGLFDISQFKIITLQYNYFYFQLLALIILLIEERQLIFNNQK